MRTRIPDQRFVRTVSPPAQNAQISSTVVMIAIERTAEHNGSGAAKRLRVDGDGWQGQIPMTTARATALGRGAAKTSLARGQEPGAMIP